ncbi:YadA-like family protein [Pseudomonas stutzeri]|uniref:YadA-like family protein n=1 Tax=Stutzerimonas stutzeri TaxID=316 RepID=UPI000C9B9FC6|nr:YadA-like family protein [Stutzerimonas stutzeri]MCQ4279121.1 YadA-like family protein [Stutzerimonas stutzeri]PNF74576.1 hypothetical protein CXK96_01555 [Stutzerimonas stutzeri]
MQRQVCKGNSECTQPVAYRRKSLLACALLAVLAGNQAMAEVIVGDEAAVGGNAIEVSDASGNTTFIESSSILIFDSVGNNVVIRPGEGISVSGVEGTSVIKSDGTDSNIAGNLTVQGDVGTVGSPVGSVNSTNINNSGAINTGSVSASAVNGTAVNSVTIVNSGVITTSTLQADSVNATTINGGAITGSLNAAGEKITNVAAGTDGTDAVNYDQLRAVQNGYDSQYNELANQTNARFDYMENRIDRVEEVANAGVASVAALAAIPAPAHGKRFSVGAGLGSYSSESAVAVGFRAAITESTSVTAGLSRNTASKTAANLGVGYSW